MFDVSPRNLYTEAISGQELVEQHMVTTRKLVLEYTGRHYRKGQKPDQPVPDPHNFQWLAQFTPRVAFDNPKASVSSFASGTPRKWLARIKHGINRWAVESKTWPIFRRVWYDTAFGFGVIRTGMEPIPGFLGNRFGHKPHRPKIKRVPPRFYIQDPRSGSDPEHPRWRGEFWIRDKSDLMDDPRFNHGVIEAIAPNVDTKMELGQQNPGHDMPDRKQIAGYEIWVGEYELPGYKYSNEFNGTVFTLGVDSNPESNDQNSEKNVQWIRDPFPFFGPREGPYELFGIYCVPDQVYPLSPLAATRAQVLEYNAHRHSAARAANRQKRIIAVDTRNAEAAEKIKASRDGGVYLIDGLAKGTVVQLEISGTTDSQYKYTDWIRENKERATGLDDAGAGRAPKVGTATGQSIAEENRSDRTDFMAKMYQGHCGQVLWRAGWYMAHSELMDWKLGDAAIEDLKPRPKLLPPESQAEVLAFQYEFLPDRPTGEDLYFYQMTFADRLEAIQKQLRWEPELWLRRDGGLPSDPSWYEQAVVKVEPLSMERTNQPLMRRHKLEFTNLLLTMIPLITQYPDFEWIKLLDDLGNAFNQQNAGDFVAKFLETVQQNQLAIGGMAGGDVQPGQAQPGQGQPGAQQGGPIASTNTPAGMQNMKMMASMLGAGAAA